MSIRSIRTAARRSPVVVGALALSATLTLTLAGCGDDVVDDGVEEDLQDGVDDVDGEMEEDG